MAKVRSLALSGALTCALALGVPGIAFAEVGEADAEGVQRVLETVAPTDLRGSATDLSEVSEEADSLLGTVSLGIEGEGGVSLLSAADFPDCVPGAWYIDAVDYVSNRGIITGYSSDGRFAPADVVTRGQLVTILWRLAGEPKPTGVGFPDLKSDDFFCFAALWAQRNGIISGREYNGTYYFDGNSPVLRQEAVKMLAKYAELCGCDISSDGTKLHQISGWNLAGDWSLPYFGWAVDKGLISGVELSDGTTVLDAEGETVRAAMAKMIMVLDSQVTLGAKPNSPEEPPVDSQTQCEQRVLEYIRTTLDNKGLSGKGWFVVLNDDASSSLGRCFILYSRIDQTLSQIKYVYNFSYSGRQSLYELADSLDSLSLSMYKFSIQEGANLPVVCVMMTSDDEIAYATKNGSTLLPYSFTLR